MIEIFNGSSHDNGLVIAPVEHWTFSLDSNVCYKLGGKAGLTVSETIKNESSMKRENLTYKNMVKIAPSHLKYFATQDDSGSIYYSQIYCGYIPIAIHRSSENGLSYGASFLENFKKIVEKKGLGEIESFKPCQIDATNQGFDCEGRHTTYFGPLDNTDF